VMPLLKSVGKHFTRRFFYVWPKPRRRTDGFNIIGEPKYKIFICRLMNHDINPEKIDYR